MVFFAFSSRSETDPSAEIIKFVLVIRWTAAGRRGAGGGLVAAAVVAAERAGGRGGGGVCWVVVLVLSQDKVLQRFEELIVTESWYSFVDHPASDTPNLFIIFAQLRNHVLAHVLCLSFCSPRLHGGVRWTATVMAAAFPFTLMYAFLVHLLLRPLRLPAASSVSRHTLQGFVIKIVLSFLVQGQAKSSHCSVWSLQGSWYSWSHTCVFSLSRIAFSSRSGTDASATADGRPQPAVTRTLQYAADIASSRNGQQMLAKSLQHRWKHEIQIALLRRRAAMAHPYDHSWHS